MAVSQNGWGAAYQVGNTVRDVPPLTKLSWITGSVRSGDVWTVLNEVARRFNNEVEKINPAESWGYAPRPIRGSSTTLSNHASGTAVDFNAPRHPLGAVNTFSTAQRAAIRRILKDLGGVVRWGGDYTGRKDEMHFEINASAAAVKKVANQIRNGATAPITPPAEKEDDMFEQSDRNTLDYVKRVVVENQRRIDKIKSDVWNVTVNRGGQQVPVIQELADTKTGLARLEGVNAALAAALEAANKGNALTVEQIANAAAQGAERALKGGVKVEISIPEVGA
ncbi:L-alanyl-D-glutamate peptidase [Stenotrophomonas virus Jojan60]|nr:L-alanyl-D-glutamate peptidase [Stenotrophomonas virus Jojan60]